MNHANLIARRWFLEQCGVGLGAIALQPAAGRSRDGSAGAEAAALRAEGEARHLPVHGRRAEPPGTVRQQAAAGEVRRHAAAGRAARRAIARRSSIRTRSCSGRSSSSPSTGRAAPSCPSCCRTLAKIVDDIAIVKSMVTDAFNHAPGQILMNTGSQQFGRPSMGSWTLYGLGSESQDLPGFVVFSSGKKGPSGGNSLLGQRLPADRVSGRAVPQRRRPGAVPVEPARRRRQSCSATRSTRSASSTSMRLDASRAIRRSPRASTRSRWRTACRSSAPELMDISQGAEARSRDVRRRAGQAVVRQQLPAGAAAGRARRAVRAALPRGLGPARQPGQRPHEELPGHRPGLRGAGQGSEAARAAGRHAGDLGRRVRPHADGAGRQRRPRPSPECLHDVAGRRRHQAGRHVSARRDELGFNVVEDQVHVHDLHATILHLLGFDHTKLTLPLPGPRLPADRRARKRGAGAAGLIRLR